MKKKYPLVPLFKDFIKATESGKRLKKNGERIKKQSVANYRYVLTNLEKFVVQKDFDLRVCDGKKLTEREFITEKNYWKKFYKHFTIYLYRQGCHDNYVGANIKVIRVFLTYLQQEKNIQLSEFKKLLYVRKEEVAILVLSPEQLKYLIHNDEFTDSLPPALRRIKDIFVFGCTTGLRYSDIFTLTNKNFEEKENRYYLKIRSQKTKTYSFIKLPDYAAKIYLKHKNRSAKKPVFKTMSLFAFNKNLKTLGEQAGFIEYVNTSREQQGKVTSRSTQTNVRFCDKMSSHMMRRTAITTLLILGMPEHLVRKISGHSATSSSFNRYVHYAQAYIDREIDKVHEQLSEY